MKPVIASIAFAIALLGGSSAYSMSVSGHAALSLAEAVGLQSPLVSLPHKFALQQFRNGTTTFAGSGSFTFNAVSIDCGAGDIDITRHYCLLKFDSLPMIQINGAAAQQLFATLIEAGDPSNGSAGTLHEAVLSLGCTVNIGQVKAMGGGGANCAFTPN